MHGDRLSDAHNSSTIVQHYRARGSSNFSADVSAGYSCLIHVFEYQKVHELSCGFTACHLWIAKLGSTSIDALGSLVLLESLELGESTEIGVNLSTILPSLTALKRLRLEKGQENFDMFSVFQGISSVSSLRQLELINCDIKTGFDKYFAVCSTLKSLLLIPTYVSQSVATNCMILKVLMKLNQTLETVVWAITVELLRVTELYIDANIEDAQSQLGGSIPILKPVPGSDEPVEIASASSQPDLPEEVEIVPLKKVQSISDRRVPNTKVQILKIPFGNTWKQAMSEFTRNHYKTAVAASLSSFRSKCCQKELRPQSNWLVGEWNSRFKCK